MVCRAFVLLLTAVTLQAQNIAINGKVTDQSGKPIFGAIVKLKSKQIADTTDTSGTYSLVAKISAVNNVSIQKDKNLISFKNSNLIVQLTKPAQVNIEFFNMNGKLLKKMTKNNLSAGTYHFEISNFLSAQNMLMIRIFIDKHTKLFRYTPLMKGYNNVSPSTSSPVSNRFSTIKAVVDSLQASALGYKTKSILVTSFEETVDIVLETENTGACTPSKTVNMIVSASGPHKVIVETNSDPGINEGTIYRPSDMGPGKKYPIFAWGEGACAKNGTDNSVSMSELASHGYFVIADGLPGGSGSRPMEMSDILLKYIGWAIAQNRKPCSAYYQSLDTTKTGANGFSCGGMLAMGTAHDPRITTWGLSSSGSFSENKKLWNAVHTPVLILEGHKDETGAYNNGLRDYNGIAPLGHPIMFFSNKTFGHGGDLWSSNGGDFTRINLAWLNWWLKGDTGSTGKGVLVGAGCKYCTDNNWEVKSANLP